MDQLFCRLLLNATSFVTLVAIAIPLATPLMLGESAQAAPAVEANSTEGTELSPAGLLKDDDDDDDDSNDDDHDDDDDDHYDDDDSNDDDDDRSSGGTTTTTTTTYTDISSSYWASSFIYQLASVNVVSGFPGGNFSPNTHITKAQYASLMVRAFRNVSVVRQAVSIRNVSQYYWGYSALQQAYSFGFIDLDASNSLNPEATMTKLDFLVTLARSLGYTEVTSGKTVDELLSSFTDADTIPTEYRVIIAALVEKGIVVNYPNINTLNLTSVVTRAEGCSYIYQAMVSRGLVQRVSSAYIVDIFGVFQETQTTTDTTTDVIVGGDDDDDDDDDGRRQNCNQGIGNGAEGCDPGNSRPHGGSNDEGGRTPGNR